MPNFASVDLRDVIPDNDYFDDANSRSWLKRARDSFADYGEYSFRLGDHNYRFHEKHWEHRHQLIDVSGHLRSRMDSAVNSHPNIKAMSFRGMLYRRRAAYRNLEIMGTEEALDPSNDAHLRWGVAALLHRNWLDYGNTDKFEHTHLWDVHEPYRVPTGIPKGELHSLSYSHDSHVVEPATHAYDIEHAAEVEIEQYVGRGSYALRDMFPENDPMRPSLVRNTARIHTYLTYYLQAPPFDPWDPNNWGHDPRLKTLVLQEPFAVGSTEIVLTPDFDPDVLTYEVRQPLALSQVKTITFNDPVLDSVPTKTTYYSYTVNADNTKAALTTSAFDQTTLRTYNFNVVND